MEFATALAFCKKWSFSKLSLEVELHDGLVAILPQLRRFARTWTRNAADADDLVQAACERAMTQSTQRQPDTRLDSWIYTMMRNLWISELKKLPTITAFTRDKCAI